MAPRNFSGQFSDWPIHVIIAVVILLFIVAIS
ncbi:hypothetical protein HNR23_004701 [Nocardiopsis mwathae]|uniref:Uncharacterized protein n=1 Tax=Nocardiopsis mwathae TaxID=1472723 RepID=A0A7W9YP40_9ACTN|nr:hypothetical protein [Nocardiopsis mwathae]